MKAKIRINPAAFGDLKYIKEYTSQNSEESGTKIVSKIIENIESLSRFSEKGISLAAKIEIKTNYRYLISEDYIIFYIYDNETVSIQRILHGRRDYLKILFKE